MAAKTIKMEQLKLIRRLHQKGYSIKGIVRSTGLSRNTVRKYVARMASNGHNIAASLQEDPAPKQTAKYSRLITHFIEAEEELFLDFGVIPPCGTSSATSSSKCSLISGFCLVYPEHLPKGQYRSLQSRLL
jgi:lambda repressor-like predicted transcriptional regulator